jgi:predicted dehydrogenase
MNKTRVGVVGAGYWGPKLIRNFHDLSSAAVSLVCDVRKDRLEHVQRLYPDTAITQDFQRLLASDVEAVVIATPVASHYTLAREALLAGKHVLVEKPLTARSDEAQNLVDLAKENKRVLMVGHTFEYNPAVLMLKDIIASGKLGQIFYINATRVNLGIFQRDINVVWDLAPHDLSILLFVLGADPINVSARGAAYVQPGIHDVAYLTVNFPNQVMAGVQVSWLDPCKIRRITVVGSKRMIVYDDLEPDEKIKIYDKGVDTPPYSDTFEQFKLSYRYGEMTSPRVPTDEPLHLECAHFIECIQQGKTPRSSGEVGLKIVRILEKAQTSLLNGGQREKLP